MSSPPPDWPTWLRFRGPKPRYPVSEYMFLKLNDLGAIRQRVYQEDDYFLWMIPSFLDADGHRVYLLPFTNPSYHPARAKEEEEYRKVVQPKPQN